MTLMNDGMREASWRRCICICMALRCVIGWMIDMLNSEKIMNTRHGLFFWLLCF